MDELLKQFNEFENICKNSLVGVDLIKKKIIENICTYTRMYYNTENLQNKSNLLSKLIDCYNKLFLCNATKDKHGMYMLDKELENLPNIFILDDKPVRFDIDYSLLDSINVSEGLTEDQALELLKWTANNTRDNLNISCNNDVYGNESLMGTCGLSQYSTLYPLQKLGFEVTVNNIASVGNVRHAYGTVIMPIKTDSGIQNKRYLIDCTYRQFFDVNHNVVTRYIDDRPSVGYFVSKNPEEIQFAKELLQNGFVEANFKNLEHYLKPFFSSIIPISKIDKIDEEFKKINIEDIIKNHQSEFDYDEDDFKKWGFNLEIPVNNLTR